MKKQFLMSVAVLGAATALVAPAVSADTQVANNQGTTDITYSGDTTTDDGVKDPNPDNNGSTTPDDTNTTDNNGKQVKGLTLTAVPSFKFNGADGSTKQLLKNSTTTGATTTGVTTVPADVQKATGLTGADVANGSSSIFVRDTRGLPTGYKVFAAASSLYSAGKQLNVGTLSLSVADGLADKNGAQITGTPVTDGTPSFVDVYHATTLTGQTSSADNLDTNQVTKDVLSGGTEANDLYGKVAGYGNLIAQTTQANGDHATGEVQANLKLTSANAVADQKYAGVITYTLQDANLNNVPATPAK